MPISCDAQSLADAAKCYDCLPVGIQLSIQTYLLAVIAGGSLDPQTLANQARCFRCLEGMHAEVQAYLLCNIVNG